jgi:hypothetical protein
MHEEDCTCTVDPGTVLVLYSYCVLDVMLVQYYLK